MDPSNLLLVVLVAGGFTIVGAIGTALITSHYAKKTAATVTAAMDYAVEASASAKAAISATLEMGRRIESTMDEFARLQRVEAEAEGARKERDRSEGKAADLASRVVDAAALVRSEAKEDRQEAREDAAAAAASLPESVSGKTGDPIHMIIANPNPVPVRETPDDSSTPPVS